MKVLETSQCTERGLQPKEGASATHADEGLHYLLPYVGKRVGASGILMRVTEILRPKRSRTLRPRKSYKIRIGKRSAREQAEVSKRSRITEGNWHPYIRSERYVPVPYRYRVSRRGQGTSAEGLGLPREMRAARNEGAGTRGVEEDKAWPRLAKRGGIDSIHKAFSRLVGKIQYGDDTEFREMTERIKEKLFHAHVYL